MTPFFQREFPSTLEALGEVLREALQALEAGDWVREDQLFYARLCLEEALVNAITHGNRGDKALRVRIEMSAEDGGGACRIRVYDEGGGFAPEAVPMPSCCEARGRGVALIRHCMDEVAYNAAERCLEMRMRRKALCKGGTIHD